MAGLLTCSRKRSFPKSLIQWIFFAFTKKELTAAGLFGTFTRFPIIVYFTLSDYQRTILLAKIVDFI
jgi:hypothetical protein